MKTLKKGTENPNWGKEFTCKGSGVGKSGGCGALLLVSPKDVKEVTKCDYGGGSDTYYWFVCPECGAETDVSPNAFNK